MLPPPPQETVTNSSRRIGANQRYLCHLRRDRFGACAPGTNNIPSDRVHNQDAGIEDGKAGRGRAEETRAVVATLMVKVVGVVALNVRLPGNEQAVLVGAPVQVRDAVPLIP